MINYLVKTYVITIGFLAGFLLNYCNGYGQGTLEVMSLNVRYDNPSDAPNSWNNRLPLIIRTINEQSPDIIGFQEVLKNQLDDLDSLLPGYGNVGVGRDNGREAGEYSPVFYKKESFEIVDHGTFWLSPTPRDTGSIGWDAALPRIVTSARLREMHQQQRDKCFEFYFLNTHFDHVGDTARQESVRLILEFIRDRKEGLNTVLTGDFNFDPAQEPYKLITSGEEDLPGLQDACQIIGVKTSCDEPTYNGFGKGQNHKRIDYIFLSKAWEATRYETLIVKEDGIYISDHYPLILKFAP